MKVIKKIISVVVLVTLLSSCGAEPSLPTEVTTEATEATEAVFGIDNSMYELFLPEDYDADGKTEAFAIDYKSSETDDGCYDVTIYFFDEDGNRSTVETDLYGYYSGIVSAGKYKFIVWEKNANGPASTSYIYGSKDGSWYEPEISGKYEFFRAENDYFAAEAMNYQSENRTWIKHKFAFIEGALEFIDAEEAKHMQEIDVDYLTKYYWAPNSGDGYYEYQFNKDGTYICYDEYGSIYEQLCGKYSLRNNTLIFHDEWGDSICIYADGGVSEYFDEDEKIFYYPGSEISYIRNTGVVCDGTRKPREKSGYEKILDGDFSYVAGVYEYPSGNKFEILSNGLSPEETERNAENGSVKFKVERIRKRSDGSYIWDISCYDNGECVDGVGCILYPVGVEVVAYDGSILETDTSKIRYWSGNAEVSDVEYIAYREENGSSLNTQKEEKEVSKLIKVGIINNAPNDSGYRIANDADMKKVFTAENGYEASFAYSLKNDEQIASAQRFIQDGVDYLLISAAGTTGWETVLKTAKNAGIHVILFDRIIDVDDSLYVASIVSDMALEGETAVNWLDSQKLDTYNIIHLQGVMGSAAQIGRSGALEEMVGTNDNWNFVTQQTAEWNAEIAQQIVQAVIDTGKDFNIIYAENDDMAKGAVAALDASGITHGVDGDVIIVSFDGNKWALNELLSGSWNYNVQYSPFHADHADEIIQNIEDGVFPERKIVIVEDKAFDAKTITWKDIAKYGI